MHARSLAFAFACAFPLVVVGCSSGHPSHPSGDGDAGIPPTGLAVVPSEVVVGVDGAASASQPFHVYLDGADVTSRASFAIDDDRLGAFQGAVFQSTPGAVGKSTIRAAVGNETATAKITLRIEKSVVLPGAPADAPSRFNGPDDPSRAPKVAYPPDGALIPPNLNELQVQYTDEGNTLFEVTFAGDAIQLKLYATCDSFGTGCALTPDEATWKLLSGAGRGGSLTITVRGTDGSKVGAAAPITLSFADEDMQGGLYYWAAGAGGLYRYDFGRRGQSAEAFYTPKQAPGTMCVGCHALSRNGKRIAVGLNAPTPTPTLRLLDVATRKTLFDQGGMFGGGSNFEALTPDGSKVITTETGGLTIHDAQTGATVGNTLANANMPDVSPDGARVVFARDTNGGCQFGFCMTLATMSAGLFTATFTGTAFGAPKSLVPSGGANNYYPSFSPDGNFVVFNRSSSTSYDAADAKVMVIPTAGGPVVNLAAVNSTTGNSWPKWAPFVHHFQGATIFWITFSSKKSVGLSGTSNSQLWMVPVDAAKLQAGQDPGYPPVWLPFQDASTGNHIAQWVETIERAPCTDIDNSGCMDDEVCDHGMCVPKIQ